MKSVLIILVLLTGTFFVFGQKPVIHPKKGEIVFTSEPVITDEKLLDESFKEMINRMTLILKEVIKKEREILGEKVDTTALNANIDDAQHQAIPLQMMADLDAKKDFRQVYKDGLIRTYISQDDQILGDIAVIDPTKSTFTTELADGQKLVDDAYPFEYTRTSESSIKEFRNEKKVINGYNCFKVLYQFKEVVNQDDDDDEDGDIAFVKFMSNYIHYREFWVTEEIQSLFHPVCKEKEILQKYYPLQVTEWNDLLKGMVQIYTLKSITLSN